MEALVSSNNVLFVLLGAIMVLAMHAGFAFLEVGTVRKKNQVNALVKTMVDFSISTWPCPQKLASIAWVKLAKGAVNEAKQSKAQYTLEFKQAAIPLVKSGQSIKQVATTLGKPHQTL